MLVTGLTVKQEFLYIFKVRVKSREPLFQFLLLDSPALPSLPYACSQIPTASVPAVFFFFFSPGMFQFMVNYFYFLVTLTL